MLERPRTGILTPNATEAAEAAEAAHSRIVRIDLDVAEHRFLADHVVDSRPLLSTVMGIEAIGCAVAVGRPNARITAISEVQVGPPYFLAASGQGQVEVAIQPDATGSPDIGARRWRAEVRSDAGVCHFRAVVTEGGPAQVARSRDVPTLADAEPVVLADDVYRLYFHGPSFRVLASAGLADDAMIGSWADGLPTITEPARTSITAPLLVELCLQTAGLWELAVSGQMRIPAGIDRISRSTDVEAAASLRAVVTPRTQPHVFDATVLDADGGVHLVVEGYRTAEFGHPHDSVAAAQIRTALGCD